MAGNAGSLTPTAGELQAGFAAFVEASHRLEARYAELKARAAAVDEQLQATNARLAGALAERDAIFAALPLGVIARRGGGEVVFTNGEAARLCELARRHGTDLSQARPGDWTLGDGGVRVRCADLPDGELVLIEDRSRIRELEREVHRLDRLAGLSELALGVAHEIKNPLNGAMGFAELLLRGAEGDAARRHAARIRAGLQQVDDIVKSLLAFARPEHRSAPTATVASIVAEAAAAAGLRAAQIELRGDAAQRVESAPLQRVLAVLFRNAQEAKGAGVNVRLQARSAGSRLELEVEDDGPGVPAAIGERAFEPFVSGKEQGTGLGLALAARVLSFLGGDLALLNPGAAGARFRIRMPMVGSGVAAPGAPPSGSLPTVVLPRPAVEVAP